MTFRFEEIEGLLNEIPLAITYVDAQGIVRYQNKNAQMRPSIRPREIGLDIRDCHEQPESHKKIAKIFEDFRNGRKIPHHYVSQRTGIKEMVYIIPNFQGERFVGCLAVIHPLEVKGDSRTF